MIGILLRDTQISGRIQYFRNGFGDMMSKKRWRVLGEGMRGVFLLGLRGWLGREPKLSRIFRGSRACCEKIIMIESIAGILEGKGVNEYVFLPKRRYPSI
jgi:hypothetical protein